VFADKPVLVGATEGDPIGDFVKTTGATLGNAVLGTDDGAIDGLLVG